MILNELTNADAIEAAKEETWEEASEVVREETWKEASEVAWKAASEATQQQVLDLINQGLTSEQLKQVIERERLRVVPQTAKTESFKR